MISPDGVHTGQLPTYPAPRPPMVGQYLGRKKCVAAGLNAIDPACSVVAMVDTRPSLDITCIQGVSAADATCAVLADLGVQGLTGASGGR